MPPPHFTHRTPAVLWRLSPSSFDIHLTQSLLSGFGSEPGRHAMQLLPSLLCPTSQLAQSLRAAFGSCPTSHVMQSAPSREMCLSPTTLHFVQFVANSAEVGWLPSAQLWHCLPSSEYASTHGVQLVRLPLGSYPAGQRRQAAPLSLYQNESPAEYALAHGRHLVRLSPGIEPGSHFRHAAPSAEKKAPPKPSQLTHDV